MKKIISLLLAMLMVSSLAACSKKEESSSQVKEVSSTSTAESEPVEEEPLEVAFLTGLEKGPDYPEGDRFVAVMVNNIAGSRPTSGLSDADMVYEIVTEGGITRFMALYQKKYETLPRIGSVRSARDQFLQLIIPFTPFLVHDGQSTVAKNLLDEYEYHHYDLAPNTGATFRRDRPGMKREYTEYTDGEHISNAISSGDFDTKRTYNSPMFNFVPYNKEPFVPENKGEEVGIVHSASYRTLFNYDSASSKYIMSQFNSSKSTVEQTIDENNNQQLSFDNVVVLFAPMTLYPGTPLTKVDYYGGAGYQFTQGGYRTLKWHKGGPHEALRLSPFESENEDEVLALNPGKTYIAIVDDKYLEDFAGALTSGQGSEQVAAGEGNTNEVEAED